MPFNDWGKEFLQYIQVEKGYSEHTLHAYRGDLDQWLTWMEEEGETKADHLLMRRYLNYLNREGYSKKTLVRKIGTLKSFFKYLVREEYVTENPMVYIISPKVEKGLPKFLYEYEVESLMNAPDTSTPEGLRDRCIFEVDESAFRGGVALARLLGEGCVFLPGVDGHVLRPGE